MRRLVEFFREMKRRRVFRVAGLYLAVGWGVIEFSSYLIGQLRAPDWTEDLVLILVIVGFPISLVMAWAFEVTPEGVVRDPSDEGDHAYPPGDRGRRPGSGRSAGGGRRQEQGGGAPRPGGRAGPGGGGAGGRDTYDGKTVAFTTPSSGGGTVQLLPGRLEVLEGADQGQDVRFEKPPSGEPEFTFGRRSSPGDPTHVELKVPTVSREHAVMRWEDDGWEIENRSTTNPLRVDGEELTEEGATIGLSGGERIEMGRVAFRFHER